MTNSLNVLILQVVLIGDEPEVPYMRPPLSKDLFFTDNADVSQTLQFRDVSGNWRSLRYANESFYDAENITFMKGHKVVDLSLEDNYAILDNQQVVTFEKVLIATGGKPKVIDAFGGLPDSLANAVSTYRNVNDFRHLYKLVSQPDLHIAVIGGSFLGSELAYALAQKGNDMAVSCM